MTTNNIQQHGEQDPDLTDRLFARVTEEVAKFSKFGIERRVFLFDRNGVLRNIGKGLIEEPLTEDAWVAAIIAEHLDFSDLVGPNGLNLELHWE